MILIFEAALKYLKVKFECQLFKVFLLLVIKLCGSFYGGVVWCNDDDDDDDGDNDDDDNNNDDDTNNDDNNNNDDDNNNVCPEIFPISVRSKSSFDLVGGKPIPAAAVRVWLNKPSFGLDSPGPKMGLSPFIKGLKISKLPFYGEKLQFNFFIY